MSLILMTYPSILHKYMLVLIGVTCYTFFMFVVNNEYIILGIGALLFS